MSDNYINLSDVELIDLIKTGDIKATESIFERYKRLISKIAHSYFIVGADSEDLISEGMIGLFNAINTYNGKSKFITYAYICIKSSILSLIKKYQTDKSKPLSDYISLTGNLDLDVEKSEIVIDDEFDPELEYIHNESFSELYENIKGSLSGFEYNILHSYLQGYSYEEIAREINKDVKSVDNAMQRIRKKISKIIKGE